MKESNSLLNTVNGQSLMHGLYSTKGSANSNSTSFHSSKTQGMNLTKH